MKRYETISLGQKDSNTVGVYDFSIQKATDLKVTLGNAINYYNKLGYFVSAVDRLTIDPIREDRLYIMSKEVEV